MAFETWDNPNERKSLQRERQARLASTPISSFQYSDVIFTAANTDTEIPITLQVGQEGAATIRFIPVSLPGAGTVYRDVSASAKAWSPTRIYLRFSSTGTVRMLIFTEA